MMLSTFRLPLLLSLLPFAFAGFNTASTSNVAIYWGQNSYGQGTGCLAQQRLSYYCANSKFNIIPLAFLTTITNPSLNLANAGDLCTAISGSSLFYCSQVEADIQTCQQTYGKTILLSIGGATYTEGGFSSSAAATAAATTIWSIFGPKTSESTAPRPFGNAVIDGFDFDFEATVSNMVPFANQLRTLMDTATASGGKQYYLTAAPQCPYPDAADGAMLAGAVYFDAIFIQFYNNYCGLPSYVAGAASQFNFNFATWDNWAKTISLNPNVKLFLGIPGGPGGGAGYTTGSSLSAIITYSKSFSSFGGVMIWDMSQAYANSGFLDSVGQYLGLPATPPSTTLQTSKKSSSSLSISLRPTTSSLKLTVTSKVPTSPKVSSTQRPATTSAPTKNTKFSTSSSKFTTLPKVSSTKNSITTSALTKSTKGTITTTTTTTITTSIPATTSAASPTTTTGGSAPNPSLVNQWNQCGGQDWNGGTVCVPPYECVFYSVWFSMCK